MNFPKPEQKTLEPVHPLDVLKPKWEIDRKSVQIDSFVVRHDIQPPATLSFLPITHCMIGFMLSRSSKEYRGSFSSGEFFLQPAKTSGFYSWLTTDESVFFIIEPDFLSRIARETECLNPEQIELKPILCDRDSNIEYIARSFLNEMQNDGIGGRLYSETLATQLGIHLLREYCTFPIKLKQYSGGLSQQKLQTSIDYIQANLEAKIKLDDLAKITQISPYHFSRLFKQSTGITPYQYVLKQRIELGKQLLRKELPIAEIAIMCGFASQSSFTTAFRKLVGVTPRNYRMNSK